MEQKETQEELNIGIGTLEPEKKFLKPAKVKIVNVEVIDVKKAKKFVFIVNHPEAEGEIGLSSVSYIQDKSLKVSGTWLNLDKEGKIQKGSATAIFLNFLGVNTPKEAIGKECFTVLDGQYLALKAY